MSTNSATQNKFRPNDRVIHGNKEYRITWHSPVCDNHKHLYYQVHRGQCVKFVRADKMEKLGKSARR